MSIGAGTGTAGVNDFVIKIANVNGTGSASANSLLMKAIFRMGIPVAGKNYFPSNIQGLPTWYEIRVSKDGYVARSGQVHVMVAMNAETYQSDLDEIHPGGYLVYDSTWPRKDLESRGDINVIGIPLSAMCNEAFENARAKVLMKNIAYLGALVALLDIDMDVIKTLLQETFASKPNLIDANLKAINMGFEFVKDNYAVPLPLHLRAMNKTDGHILVDGNTTAGLGAVYAGATVASWYPITPSTSLIDSFSSFCQQLRVDPETGENRYCIVQAEDELAAIGMVLGASWNGARAFTSTSGPGISLMGEFLGLAYYAEIPAVIFNVQRVGPSTGMPTRTQQGDVLACAYASHGDTRHVLLFPSDPAECFELAVDAFDLAEGLQTPVIVMSDLDIGMNDWMIPELDWHDDYVPNRGKVYQAADLRDLTEFHRYVDRDKDGIAWRTLPGVDPKGAYFVRGSGHNTYGGYTEISHEYQEVLDRLRRKFDTASQRVPKPIIDAPAKSDFAIVSIGSCDGAIKEARDRFAADGMAIDYMRIRAFPFSAEVESFINDYERVYIVEQNRDAQLRHLVVSELAVDSKRMVSILSYDGMPIDCGKIIHKIGEDIRHGKAA